MSSVANNRCCSSATAAADVAGSGDLIGHGTRPSAAAPRNRLPSWRIKDGSPRPDGLGVPPMRATMPLARMVGGAARA